MKQKVNLPYAQLHTLDQGEDTATGVGGWEPAAISDQRRPIQLLRPSRKALINSVGEALGLPEETLQDLLKELLHERSHQSVANAPQDHDRGEQRGAPLVGVKAGIVRAHRREEQIRHHPE